MDRRGAKSAWILHERGQGYRIHRVNPPLFNNRPLASIYGYHRGFLLKPLDLKGKVGKVLQIIGKFTRESWCGAWVIAR